MAFPQIRDQSDDVVALLKQIARNTGALDDDDGDQNQIQTPRRPLSPGGYLVVETADMEYATPQGTRVVEPGQELPVVEYEIRQGAGMLLAIGATDEQNVSYRIEVDRERTIGGRTQSPLGVLNDEFSFVQMLGGAIPARDSFTYYAAVDPEAGGPVELAARMHVEEGR